jgi:glyoxylase-like metal-dependent hydrolase (beta-lactamase superfamily II)
MQSKRMIVILVVVVWLIEPSALPSQDLQHPGPDRSLRSQPDVSSQTVEPASPARNFEIEKLAVGVYAVIRREPPGLMVDANNVFIINDDGVVVVDSNGAPSITREVLAAIRKLTDKPVKYVINTHWHDDHIRGNLVYRDAFPAVEFIGHVAMREYLPNQGAVNRKLFLDAAPKFLEVIKASLDKNKSLGGNDITPEERISYLSDIRLAELVLSDGAAARAILPTIAIEDRLTLHIANRLIEIRHLGSGHTASDIVVYLPNERILVTGDLVVWPVPLVGDPQSHIKDWSVTLEKLSDLKPAAVVPGHGPVLHDTSYLKTLHEMFASIWQQTEASVSRGETLEQTRKSVKLDEFQKQLAGDSLVRRLLFSNYVAYPAVGAAFREASAR